MRWMPERPQARRKLIILSQKIYFNPCENPGHGVQWVMTAIRGILFPLLVAALPVLGQQPSAMAPKEGTSGFVGSQACKTCHADVWSKFFKNPHFKSIASGKAPPEHTGCEGCHGPGEAHIAAHRGKATIIAFSQLEPKKIQENCLPCHSQTLSRANIQTSAHTENDVVC